MPNPSKHSPRVGIRTCSDYSPFGVELDGRTVSGEYRYGFQNQEKDDEIKGEGNSVNYTFRMHDPRLGRFLSVDPLQKQFPWNGTYNYSENRVFDSRELEGLQKVSVHNYSFAPFDDFAGGYSGDGDDRRFGDKVNPGIKLNENFRIGVKLQLNLDNYEILQSKKYGAYSLWAGTADFSPVFTNKFVHNKGNVYWHFYGSNNEPIFPLNKLAPAIDIKMNIQFEATPDKNKFRVSGEIVGDKFPSNETYLTDKFGNKIFLGVSVPDGMFNESLGPYTELFFTANERMQQFNLYIEFNKDESFKSVSLGNGNKFILNQWNKKFIDLNPKDRNMGTNVSKHKIETNYDPD